MSGPTMLEEAYDPTDLGRAIRRWRVAKGMTQQTLAEWLGVSRQTVVSMEQGGPVSVAAAMRALAILGAKAVIVPKERVIDVADPP